MSAVTFCETRNTSVRQNTMGHARPGHALRNPASSHVLELTILLGHNGRCTTDRGRYPTNERAAERTSAHVKNLGGIIAPSGEPQTVLAKPDVLHSALVVDLEHEADVEQPGFARVIEREPILAILPGINK